MTRTQTDSITTHDKEDVMGKFKEKQIELMNVRKEKTRQQECDMLVIQYPMLTFFIREAFALNEEHKVHELLFALETEGSC